MTVAAFTIAHGGELYKYLINTVAPESETDTTISEDDDAVKMDADYDYY